MCGIIAYIGGRAVVQDIIVKGLSRMEYRGYDSAGICSQNVTNRPLKEKDDFISPDSELKLVKASGKVSALSDKLELVRLHIFAATSPDSVVTSVSSSAAASGTATPISMSTPKPRRINRDRVPLGESIDLLSLEMEEAATKLHSALKEEQGSPKSSRMAKVHSLLAILPLGATVDEMIESACMQFEEEGGISLKGKVVATYDDKLLTGHMSLNDADIEDMGRVELICDSYESLSKPVRPELVKPESEENGAPRFLAIGHTRWATHGAPTEENAHPHVSNERRVTVVHNGIIENKIELQDALEGLGYVFSTETDTEVIPILIEHYLKTSDTVLDAILKALSKLRGAYGLAIMVKGHDKIYGVRLGSPLCIGIGDGGEFFVASEPAAFLSYTNQCVDLDDYELAVLGSTMRLHKFDIGREADSSLEQDADVNLSMLASMELKNRVMPVPFDIEEVRKGKYAHFTLKEIHDQPRALQNTIGGKCLHEDGIERINIDVPSVLQSVTFLACGTSWHAGLIGSIIIENEVGIPCTALQASEYINRRCLLSNRDLVVAISQSGETADTREALRMAKKVGASCAGLVNVVGSQIARLAGSGMYLHAGPEIGVASTKAFTCQVCCMSLIAGFLSRSSAYRRQVTENLLKVPGTVKDMLADEGFMGQIVDIAEEIKEAKSALFMGRGLDQPVALEGALKLKEISYIHAEGFPAGEAKHGTIALIDEETPVIFVIGAGASRKDGESGVIYERTRANMHEVKARGGPIICVTDFEDPELYNLSSHVIRVPYISDAVSPVLKVLPLQLLAYHVAVKRGTNVDAPRNLAKSVTVM